MKFICSIILLIISLDVVACTNKDQLIIHIYSSDKAKLSHKVYIALGKDIFSNDMLSNQLHAYNCSIDHSLGTIIFDIDSLTMKKDIIAKTQKLLYKHKLQVKKMTLNIPEAPTVISDGLHIN